MLFIQRVSFSYVPPVRYVADHFMLQALDKDSSTRPSAAVLRGSLWIRKWYVRLGTREALFRLPLRFSTVVGVVISEPLGYQVPLRV